MFLDYFALFLLVFVSLVIFYGVIAIHDIPYEIAKRRNHPQQDALHVAGWISLFTLHAIWPFLWVWATLYREDRGWGFGANAPAAKRNGEDKNENDNDNDNRRHSTRPELIDGLQQQLKQIEERLGTLETHVKESTRLHDKHNKGEDS
ncbi:MAG: DUF3302 domain-containing protein [Orrella sp.]